MDAERRFRHVRPNAPLILLLVGIAIMAVVAFEAYRAVRTQHETVREVLGDYTAFAAWSLEKHVRDELDASFWELLQAVNHGDALHTSPDVPTAQDLGHYTQWDSAGCYCHRARYPPTAFFALTLGEDALDIAPNLYDGPGRGIRVVEAPDGTLPYDASERRDVDIRRFTAEEREAIARRLTVDARTRYVADWRTPVLVHESPAGRSLIGYTLMPTVGGDTLVYAVELAPSSVHRLFDAVLDDDEVLPDAFTRDRSNRDVLVAVIADDAGRPIYRSDAPVESEHTAVESLPVRLDGMTVRTTIRPSIAGSLVIGGLPRSRLPVLLALLALACALTVGAAIQMRRAGELARMRTDFVASVSHELRTPLTQIRMYLQTARLGRFQTEAQRDWLLENADRESARLAHLVANVLAFARRDRSAGAADDPMPADPVDVASEVRRSVDAYRPLAASRRLRIALDLTDGPHAAVPADELRQVLFNLLDNASKYGPPGQTVTVRSAPAGERVRVSVADEGPGIDEDERDRIWEPFHRGRDGASAAVGGSGLGLSIVRDIVDRRGGSAWVEAATTGGARFVVTLPCVDAPAAAAGDDPRPAAADASAAVPGR